MDAARATGMIDHLFADFSLPDVPGASILVLRNDEIVAQRNFGLADLAAHRACQNKTNYRLASLTKQFTAFAVLILFGEKQLSLGDSLNRFFPDFPAWGHAITIQHLLTHTSGVPGYEDFVPDGAAQVHDQDVLNLVERHQPLFKPGSQFHYSNSGYALLALVVEKVSGQPFADFLQQKIFAPLGMIDTVALVEGKNRVPERALGYAAEESGGRRRFKPSDQSTTSAVLGDGGVYSNLEDLRRWNRGLNEKRLLPAALYQQIFKPWSPTSDSPGSGYGFGWYVGEYKGSPWYWHYGATCGFSTFIERHPQKILSIIILCNRRSAPLAEISGAVRELFWNS